jgi:hypothetical protein
LRGEQSAGVVHVAVPGQDAAKGNPLILLIHIGGCPNDPVLGSTVTASRRVVASRPAVAASSSHGLPSRPSFTASITAFLYEALASEQLR